MFGSLSFLQRKQVEKTKHVEGYTKAEECVWVTLVSEGEKQIDKRVVVKLEGV
jgi:hypothetical protein